MPACRKGVMMSPTYKSPRALEMAVKEAAKLSPLDTGKAVSGFYFHRLLCRVFADENIGFVLKGGQGMLARTLDARTTRDAHDRQFASLCAQTGLVDSLRLRKNAESLASTLLEPAIRMSVTGNAGIMMSYAGGNSRV